MYFDSETACFIKQVQTTGESYAPCGDILTPPILQSEHVVIKAIANLLRRKNLFNHSIIKS